jgi:hypothetical protein
MMMMMQTGGPYYQVELGRLDGKVATRAIVKHSLPGPSFNLNQLTKLFAANGLTQTDMIALSGIHILSLSLHRQARTHHGMPNPVAPSLSAPRSTRSCQPVDS